MGRSYLDTLPTTGIEVEAFAENVSDRGLLLAGDRARDLPFERRETDPHARSDISGWLRTRLHGVAAAEGVDRHAIRPALMIGGEIHRDRFPVRSGWVFDCASNQASIFAAAIAHCASSISIPMHGCPARMADKRLPPCPMNGSKTTPPP